MEEIWKDIPGYEGYYQVSNLGRVKSRFKILKPSIVKGYYRICLSNNNKKKNIFIHQLVSMAFLNHKPCGLKLVVHHKDSNNLNNNLNNLEIITNRENNSIERTEKSGLPVGVDFYHKYNKYSSRISFKSKRIFLGYFDTPEQASQVYQNKLNEIKCLLQQS